MIPLLLFLAAWPASAGWLQDRAKSIHQQVGVATGTREPSDDEINGAAAQTYAEVKAKSKLSTHSQWNELVQRVALRIEAASAVKFQWEAILIESPEVNAWCMPGGKIAVYTGLMRIMKTEAALAAVMGHEVAHATLKHGKKSYARAMQQQTVKNVAQVANRACQTEACRLLAGTGGTVGAFGLAFFDRKFSRADESSADRWGQYFMAKAGYDPEEAVRVWDRMSAASGGNAPPEWISTHPSDETRKTALQGWLPSAQVWYKKAPQKFALGSAIE